MFRYIKKIYKRICTVLAYAKQGWNTEDWDYAYLLQDLCFKIRRIRSEIKVNSYLTEEDIKEITVEITLVEDLIDRILKDDYCSDIPEHKMILIPIENKEYSRVEFELPKGYTELQIREMYWLANARREDDWHLLWKYLDKWVRNWWE